MQIATEVDNQQAIHPVVPEKAKQERLIAQDSAIHPAAPLAPQNRIVAAAV